MGGRGEERAIVMGMGEMGGGPVTNCQLLVCAEVAYHEAPASMER